SDRRIEWYEASATNGPGVFETLKAISKLTLRSLKSKMKVEGRKTVSASGVVPIPAAALAAPRPAGVARPEPGDSTLRRLARFREFQEAHAQRAVVQTMPAPPPPPFVEAVKPLEPLPDSLGDEAGTEVRFAELKSPEPPPAAEAAVRHVRVRSSVDILSELEKLRKLSTQRTPLPEPGGRPKSSATLTLEDILSGTRNHRRDVSRSVEVTLPKDALGKSRLATVSLRLQDDAGGEVAPATTVSIDLANLRDIQKLLLALKFNVHGK
ncbi:MAG: hypothetical protein ACM3JH_09005, partial [Acidithiobacillales bacterium]